MAVANDDELHRVSIYTYNFSPNCVFTSKTLYRLYPQLLKDVTISQGGVLPHINEVLITKKGGTKSKPRPKPAPKPAPAPAPEVEEEATPEPPAKKAKKTSEQGYRWGAFTLTKGCGLLWVAGTKSMF